MNPPPAHDSKCYFARGEGKGYRRHCFVWISRDRQERGFSEKKHVDICELSANDLPVYTDHDWCRSARLFDSASRLPGWLAQVLKGVPDLLSSASVVEQRYDHLANAPLDVMV